MSILNLALQNVSLARAAMSDECEAQIRNSSSMADIREACHNDAILRQALLDSIRPVKEALAARFTRLQLKDDAFISPPPAAQSQIDALVQLILNVDPNLAPQSATAKTLKKSSAFQLFAQNHMKIEHYLVQVKKCGKQSCQFCSPFRLPEALRSGLHFLPDPQPRAGDSTRYGSFDDLYGTVTSGKFRPSAKSNSATGETKEDDDDRTSFSGPRARSLITCAECARPRVIYAQFQLDSRQQVLLDTVTNLSVYQCGDPLHHEENSSVDKLGDGRANRLYMKKHTCHSIVERAYYSCKRFPDVCSHCGDSADLATASEEVKARWKVVLPICTGCISSGKVRHTFLPNKVTPAAPPVLPPEPPARAVAALIPPPPAGSPQSSPILPAAAAAFSTAADLQLAAPPAPLAAPSLAPSSVAARSAAPADNPPRHLPLAPPAPLDAPSFSPSSGSSAAGRSAAPANTPRSRSSGGKAGATNKRSAVHDDVGPVRLVTLVGIFNRRGSFFSFLNRRNVESRIRWTLRLEVSAADDLARSLITARSLGEGANNTLQGNAI